MIVKNEEKVLDRCLKSIKDLFDEIVIVDTGSNDNTIKIAQKYTNKIFYFCWCDNFSKARNYAIKNATSEYIFWLDADDIMPYETYRYIKSIKDKLTSDVYMLKYNIAFKDNKPTFSFYRERIIKNCDKCYFSGCVHECITPFGKVEKLNCSIDHKKENFKISNRNLKIYQKTIKQRPLNARELYYYARELFDHKKYKMSITYLKKFINTNQGWIENIIDAYYLMSKCYLFLGNLSKQFECLTKTFLYDKPRANVCCAIGDYFLYKKNYQTAKYWYTLATQCEDVTKKGGFCEPLFYNYYPYLQLCVCCYNLGNIKEANNCNEMAGKFLNSEIVKKNREFFISQKN